MGGFISSATSEFSKLTSGLPDFINPNPPPGGITNMRAPIAIKAAEGKQVAQTFNTFSSNRNFSSGLKVFNRTRRFFGKSNSSHLALKGALSAYGAATAEKKKSTKTPEEQRKNSIEGAKMLAKLPGILKEEQKRKEAERKAKELPPIVPKGEFVPMFGPFMKEIRIENVTRENFIDTFINKIMSMDYINNKYWNEKEKHTRGLMRQFKDVLISKIFTKQKIYTYEKLEKEKQYEEELKEISYEKGNKGNNELKNELQNNINELTKKQAKIKEYLDEINKIINTKKDDNDLVKKLKEKSIVIKKENVTPIHIFIQQNIIQFLEKINLKLVELDKIIKQIEINSETAEERILKKIDPIIESHRGILTNLSTIFTNVTEKDDIDKLIKMTVILSKINSKNKEDYINILQEAETLNSKRKKDDFVLRLGNFESKLQEFYEKLPKTNKTNVFEQLKKFNNTKAAFEKEIKEFDMDKLQSTLNELLTELYKKFRIVFKNEDIPKISGKVPPKSLHKSINYDSLLKIITDLLKKLKANNNTNNKKKDRVKILKLKIIIDEFMSRMGSSNFEKIRYDINSPYINSYLESSVGNFKSESNKLKQDYKSKSIEQLKNEMNELLKEIFSKYYPDSKNILQIGNIGNTLISSTEIKKNNNSTSVAKTKTGNLNQSKINNNELKQLKNNQLQSSLILS